MNYKYTKLVMPDREMKIIIWVCIIAFIIVTTFFNRTPENEFEIWIDSHLLSNMGIYSKLYPFYSKILSNLIAFFVPVISLIFILNTKYIYVSKEELLNEGFILESYKDIKMMAIKTFTIIIFLILCFLVFNMIYLNISDLDLQMNSGSYIRDNILFLFIGYMTYILGGGIVFCLTATMFLNFKNFFFYQYRRIGKNNN